MRLSVSPLSCLLSLLSVLFTFAPRAHAQECGVSLDMYEDAPLVADLHPRETLDALERGDLVDAAARARDALNISRLQRDLGKNRLQAGTAFGEDDIRAALAVAVVRSGGAEGIARAASARAASARSDKDAKIAQRNLADARKLLQALARFHAGDPVVTTYLAEAHLALGERDDARALLEDLAAADLIVSAEGWAALAAVTDGELAANARTRCAAMARDAKTCAPSTSPSTTPHDTQVVARAPRS
jgi:hypothetical protein